MPRRWMQLLAMTVFLSAPFHAKADEDDHERARQALEAGEIMPLRTLLDQALGAEDRLLEAELEREHGRLIYEITFMTSKGRVIERMFDARSGEPILDGGADDHGHSDR